MAAPRAGRAGRRQGAGARRRPRQGRRRQAGRDARTRPRRRPQAILGMEIKGLPVRKVLVAPARRHRPRVLPRASSLDREAGQPLMMVAPRGRHRHRGGRPPRRPRRSSRRTSTRPAACARSRRGELAFAIEPDGSKARGRSPACWSEALPGAFVGVDASLAEINPLVVTPRRRGRGARRQDQPRRQRALRAARARGAARPDGRDGAARSRRARRGSPTSSSTAPSAASSTAPAWRWPRWTWSSTSAASRPTSSTSAAARARRRSSRRCEIIPPTRTCRRSSSTSSAASPAATTWRRGSSRRSKRTQHRAARSSSGSPGRTRQKAREILEKSEPGDRGADRWTRRCRRRASSWPTGAMGGDGREHPRSTRARACVVQGITGRDGAFHARAMMRLRHARSWRASRRARAGTKVDGVPVFDTRGEAVAETGANTSVIYVPARSRADAISRRPTPASSSSSASPRASPSLDMVRRLPGRCGAAGTRG